MAYYQLEPFGMEADNWRMGKICATIANCHVKKGAKTFRPEDFMPSSKEPQEQTWEQQLKFCQMLEKAFKNDNAKAKKSKAGKK
ncbi:MAG: hypothetical protein GX163_11315 [Bacteroidetes bacterium]|jgi:hypothetical protein|nr:hypothetical protein [Bacteroidota bacterium]